MPVAQLVLRVLFIGNSLTAANDLPAMVVALARSAHTDIRVETIALPDFGLPEHWDDGRAVRAIRRHGWTHVVLQQGPSSLMESRCVLLEYARKFAAEIRSAGAEPVLYSVWPPRNRSAYSDAVSDSYLLAAKVTNSALAPAGEAWRIAWTRDPNLPLYSGDGFHPSKIESYLAALAIFAATMGLD